MYFFNLVFLQELKTKGLTKKELDMAIKKERRSAEKTLGNQ